MKAFEVLSKTFLFSGLNTNEISELINEKDLTIKHFLRGETIYSGEDEEKKVGFVLNGTCEVRKKKSDSAQALLNTLTVTDSFGILSIYSESKFPTQIIATKNCEILFFTKHQIENFVNSSFQITQNLIHFLTNRINFLNEKVSILSSTRVEERLIQYLLIEARKNDSDEFYFNITKTSDAINAGRASIYRALDSLQSNGLITFNKKTIKINQSYLKGN